MSCLLHLYFMYLKISNFCCFKRLGKKANIWIFLHIHLFDTQPTLAQFSFSHSVDSTSFYFYMDILHFCLDVKIFPYHRNPGRRSEPPDHSSACTFLLFLFFIVLRSKAAFVYGVRVGSAGTLRPLEEMWEKTND